METGMDYIHNQIIGGYLFFESTVGSAFQNYSIEYRIFLSVIESFMVNHILFFFYFETP